MADNKFERVAADSPHRCQATVKYGQCPFKQIEGCQFCPMHGGASQLNALKAESQRQYRLAKWKDRLGEFADNDQVKSLREEIGILRILMEETMNMCKTSDDLLLYSGKISDLALRIEKVVSSCHRLEASTGMLLDKTAALHLASVIVKIISDHVTDEDAIDKISSQIIEEITKTKTEVKGTK